MAPAPMAIPDNKLSFAVKNILPSIYGNLLCDGNIPCFALNKVMRRKVADLITYLVQHQKFVGMRSDFFDVNRDVI